MDSDSDMDVDEEVLLEKAFLITEDVSNYNPEDLPTNGHEHLARVRYEAKKCPKVIVAQLDTTKFKSKQTFTVPKSETYEIPKSYIPSEQWQLKQVENFNEIRLYIDKIRDSKPPSRDIPHENDVNKWHSFVFGDNPGKPFLSNMMNMKQSGICSVLTHFDEWLSNDKCSFDGTTCMWIYSLLACLETPLLPETCSSLRNLTQHALKSRSSVNDPEDNILTSLNLIICLVGRYFRQNDLADIFKQFAVESPTLEKIQNRMF